MGGGQKNTFSYLPHIDGLRAISILAILGFHLRPDLLPGGFIGVDIFFILSGFLITSLLLEELSNKGKINFKRFYLRRFKRLFPTYALVVLFTILYSFQAFDDQQVVRVAKSALASILGVSNMYFYKSAGYFDASSTEKPLLHIWSLNLEEQFYVVWPILLLFLFRLLSKYKFLLPLISVLLFVFSYVANQSHPIAVFYLPFFRFYEFLIGCAAAFYFKNQSSRTEKFRYTPVALFVLLIGFFLLDSTSILPSSKSMLFILPSIFLILSGGSSSILNPLKSRFFTYVGKRSYTLYLIHWPIIVFYSVRDPQQILTSREVFCIIVVIFIISHLVYKYFELPMRSSSHKNRVFSTIILTLVIAIFGSSTLAISAQGVPLGEREERIFLPDKIGEEKQLRFSTRTLICEEKHWDRCDVPLQNDFNVLVIGDSHSVDALNAMYDKFPEFDYSLSTLGGCPPTNVMAKLVPATFPDLKQCVELNMTRYDISYLRNFDLLVINNLLGWYTLDKLRDYLEFLKQNNVKKVVVFGPYLQTKKDLPLLVNDFGFDYSKFANQIIADPNVDRDLEKIVESLSFFYVSKYTSFCSGEVCQLWDENNNLFTWDTHHLSLDFGRRIIDDSYLQIKKYISYQDRK